MVQQSSHPARDVLERINRQFPGAWLFVEAVRRDKTWPDWCFVPFDRLSGEVAKLPNPTMTFPEMMAVITLATWRMTQGIYRFDPTVFREIAETPVTGDIPAEMLNRMPEWCVYIETPGLSDPAHHGQVHGVWARHDLIDDTGERVLRFLVHCERGLSALAMTIGPWSVEAGIDRQAVQALVRGIVVPKLEGSTRALMSSLLSLVLYVCTQASEITGKKGQPGNPSPRPTRRDGLRMFPADGPRVWDVGVRMGAALRRAYAAAEAGDGSARHGAMPAHVRRAHWHTFLSGSRIRPDGSEIPPDQRTRDLRWLPPIPVNLDDPENLPAVIRKVT